jgi:WD40 repeat protein
MLGTTWIHTLQFALDAPNQLTIYETVAKKEYENLPLGDEAHLISLAFNPFGDFVAVDRADGAILLINIDNLEVVTALNGHHGAVEHILFSPDGELLFSAGADGTIRSWGLP